jgi:eukaryotic-like serine/threonine-protein kinase
MVVVKPGDIIADRFRIEHLAGSGGMGTVYRAAEIQGAPIAIKVLSASKSEDEARFAREARVLSTLDHPGIVRYVAHGCTGDGMTYLAMEWLDGEDLASRLLRGRLRFDEGVELVRRAAEALGTAHERGIVHRDVKPSNLFLVDGDPERVKLLDFGIARVAATLAVTTPGAIVGTLAYMAPEQARGERDAGARVDVFALGCVLFECLTGRPVFEGTHPMAVLAKILMQDAPRLRELLVDVPPALDDLVARMLSKQAAERPRNGAAVAAELATVTTGGGTSRPTPVLPSASLTTSEQRLVSVILTGSELTSENESVTATLTPEQALAPMDHLQAIVAPYAPRLEWMLDGSVIATLTGRGAATDQVAQAARCALVIRGALGSAPIVVATGRGVLDARLPVGEAIDRAVALLRPARGESIGQPIRLDNITAGLLDERFEVTVVGNEHHLHSERLVEAETPRTFMGKPTLCVGREREIATLEAILAECVSEPVACAVLVTGPPGIGKSRVRYEFLQGVHRRHEPVEVWLARCDPMGVSVPFGLAAKVLRVAAGLLDGEPLEVRRSKLEARVARAVDEREAPRVTRFLGEMMGTPFPDDTSPVLRAARGDRRFMEDEMLRAWADFLGSECAEHATLIVLEDFHWADAASVLALSTALRDLTDHPVMVLALARPEVREVFPKLWVDRRVQEIGLGELSRRASERLVRQVLAGDIGAAVVDRIVSVAGGNAFYLEELTRAAAEGSGPELPQTVLAMVQARLETLGLEERRVLRAASVLGEVFWANAVEAMLGPVQPGEIRGRLDALAMREIVSRRARSRFANEVEYVFRHATVREAAYAMLMDQDRVLGHRLAAEWLERASGGDLLVLAQSAQHVEHAAEDLIRLGDDDAAANAFAKASVLRTGTRHFEAAVAAILRALELADLSRHEAAELVGWLGALSSSVTVLRLAQGLPHLVDRLLGRIDAAGSVEERAQARVALARALGATNVFSQAYALLDDALAAAAAHPDVQRQVFVADMEIGSRQGDFLRSLRAARALDSLGAPEDPGALSIMAVTCATGGERERALELMARAEALSDPSDEVAAAVRHKVLGLIELYTGNLATGARVAAEAAEMARALGLRYDVAASLHNVGSARYFLGEFVAARAALSESLDLAEASGLERVVALDRAYLACLDGIDGAPEAQVHLERFIANSETSGYMADVIEGSMLLASLLIHRGNRVESRSQFEQVLTLAKRLGDVMFEAEAVKALRDL